jgi:superfamily I DNA and/or RNA helicase
MLALVLPSIMLDIQYRMHPTISQFPSHEFYDQALRDGTVDARGNVIPGLVPPESIVYPELACATGARSALANVGTDLSTMGTSDPDKRPSVVFLDHVGSESLKDRSRVNWNEAYIVCSLVEDLLLRNPVSSFHYPIPNRS